MCWEGAWRPYERDNWRDDKTDKDKYKPGNPSPNKPKWRFKSGQGGGMSNDEASTSVEIGLIGFLDFFFDLFGFFLIDFAGARLFHHDAGEARQDGAVLLCRRIP